MRYILRWRRIAPISLTLLALACGIAEAGRLSIAKTKFKAKWTPIEFIAGGNTVRCNLTIKGSFHSRTIVKAADALIGNVTADTLSSCVGGSATVLVATLPWHVAYEGFEGTLPIVIGLKIKMPGLSVQWQPTGSLMCLLRATTTNPARFRLGIEGSGTITGITADSTAEIPLTGAGGLCAFGGSGHLGGTGTFTEETEEAIQIRLI